MVIVSVKKFNQRKMTLTSALRVFDATRSSDFSANRRTSFVSEEANTAPVKKSPPKIRAINSNQLKIIPTRKHTYSSMAA